MKVLTANLGLLDYKLCGAIVFANPPFSQLRMQVMPAEILKIDADIVALQECYYESDFRVLFEQLKHVYPYFARKDGRGCGNMGLNMHNGLVILSKFEVTGIELLLHTRVAAVEYWCGNKATLVAHMNVPNVGKMTVFNNHPTAGGSQPEEADADREVALVQALDLADKCLSEGSLPIFTGDFNCAPDCSAVNYQLILNRGYRDCFEEAKEAGILKEGPSATWDPLHELNANGPHNHCPPCRVDHVFLPKKEKRFGAVLNAGVVFTEKLVTVPLENKETNSKESICSLSDHYGFVAEFDVLPAPTAASELVLRD